MIKHYLHQYAIDVGCKFEQPRDGDAGFDIRSAENVRIPGLLEWLYGTAIKDRAWVHTGLHVEIPDGYVGLIRDRSSMAQMGWYTHAGVVDSSYRGEILVLIQNSDLEPLDIMAGDKIAQLIIVPYFSQPVQMVELNELKQTERGDKGFGSTGK